MTSLDDRLLPVFARQHWLVSLDDVLSEGGSRSCASKRVRAGRWKHPDVSVFRLAGAPASWEARVLAPLLAIGAPAVASHLTAAALHGLPGFGKGTPEITVPRGGDRRRRGVRVHTSTDLERSRRVVGDHSLLRAIEWSRRDRGLTWPTLISTLARHARRVRPGIRRLRRVILANAHREEVTDSDFELLVLTHLAEVDLAFPSLRIAIELDGKVHLQPEVREKDLTKQNDLVLAGWTVLRFTYERYRRHPDRVIAEIRAALQSARA